LAAQKFGGRSWASFPFCPAMLAVCRPCYGRQLCLQLCRAGAGHGGPPAQWF